MDLIGSLPTGKGQAKHAIVAVDYFTKWAEAEPLTSITERKTTEFIWKNLICRFGIPYAIVSDNGKQFDNEKFQSFCSELGIANQFATLAHPQSNGQVEAVNKIIKGILKKKLEERKRSMGKRAAWGSVGLPDYSKHFHLGDPFFPRIRC